MSQQIKRLEKVSGRAHVARTSRQLPLTTEAGETLLAHAHSVIALNDKAIRRMKAPPVTSRLRLSVSEGFIPLQPPRLLSRFGKAHPGVRLDLVTDMSPQLVAQLGEGALDLIIAKRIV